MKILFVASGNSKFGISPLVKSQGESLKKAKAEVEVEYFPISGKGLLNYLKHIFLLRKHLRFKNYDLIHAHYGLCGIVAQLARRKEKLVVSFMGDDLIGAVGNNGKYSLFGNSLVYLNKFFIPKYDYVIVKSPQLGSKIKSTDYAVIPNGVDLDNFYEIQKDLAREKLNISRDKRIIIFVSNPNRAEKNYSLAKESVDSLKQIDVELLVVNSVPQENLKYYYSAADVLLLTSYHEGSPNVIKEAMACDCPIVSTDVGDVEWVVGDTEGCFLVSQKSKVKSQKVEQELIKETREKIKVKSKKLEQELVKETSDKLREALRFAATNGRTKGRERIIELGLDSETVAKKIISIYKKVSANSADDSRIHHRRTSISG